MELKKKSDLKMAKIWDETYRRKRTVKTKTEIGKIDKNADAYKKIWKYRDTTGRNT